MRYSKTLSVLGNLYFAPSSRARLFRESLQRRTGRSRRRLDLADLSNPLRLTEALELFLSPKSLSVRFQKPVRQAIALVAERVGDGDHAEITDRLMEIGEHRNSLYGVDHERLFSLTRAIRSSGLFAASYAFEEKALKAYFSHAENLTGARGHLHRARIALATGDTDRAAQSLRELRGLAFSTQVNLLQETIRYLELAAGEEATSRVLDRDEKGLLQSIVKDATVLIYGPGPTEDSVEQSLHEAPVARVLMPGVSWNSAADLVGNRVDVAYANGETTTWLASLEANELRNAVANQRVVVFKGNKDREKALHSAIANACSAIPRPKLIDGTPNQVPIMMWDLLARGAAKIHVIGASFFLGKEPYREGNRRLEPETGERRDAFGSLGPYSQCLTLATHNASMGRQFAQVLAKTAKVTGDAHFMNALALSRFQYLEQLDSIYGRPRL